LVGILQSQLATQFITQQFTMENDSRDENEFRDDYLSWKMTLEMIFEFLNQQGVISVGGYSQKSARYSFDNIK